MNKVFRIAVIGAGMFGLCVLLYDIDNALKAQARAANALEDIAASLRNVTFGIQTYSANNTNPPMITIWRTL